MFSNLVQEEEIFVNTCMYLYFNEFLKINYVYKFGSGRGKLRKHINVSILNEFLN